MAEPPSPSPVGGAPVPRSARRRGRRIAILVTLALVLLPLLAILAGWVTLRSAAVRRELLARVTTAVEQGLGMTLTADDFSLVGWTGVELTGVRLGAPGAAPLATVQRVRASIDLFSLRRETAVVRSLEVFRPVIDLSAPFPKLPESEGPPGFEIRRIVLHDGTVVGAPVEPPASEWLTRWRLDWIEARGAFRNGPWELEVEDSTAQIERPGFPPLPLRLSGRFAQDAAGGPLRIAALQADGDGVHLEGSGRVGFGENAPSEAVFSTQIEPRLLVAGTPPGGLIEARGDLRLPESTGRVALSARDVPAEALRPYLDPKLFSDLALAGTAAEVTANLALGPKTFERIEGEAEATWKRGTRRLATLEGRVLPVAGEGPLRLTFIGDLLPDTPGRRHVQGTLAAAGWTSLADGTAEDLRAELRTADVAATFAQVRALWPRLVPALPPEIPARGSLAADLRLNGPLADPRAKVQAEWKPEADARVVLHAEGRPSTWAGKAELEVERLPLAMSRVVSEGLLTGRLTLEGSPKAYAATATADASAVSYPPYLQSADTLHLETAGTLGLAGSPSYAGTLNLQAANLFASPNASDTLRIDRLQIAADGLFRSAPLSWTGNAEIDGQGLDLPGTVQAAEIHLKTEEVTASETVLAGRLRLDAPRVDLPAASTAVSDLHLEAEGDRGEARIVALSGSLPEGRLFTASGRALLEPLLGEADLELQLTRPVDAVRSAELSASLRSGVVGLSVPRLETEAGRATLRATIPLGALLQIPQLTDTLRDLPLELTPGPIAMTLEAPELDSERLLAALGLEPRPEKVRGGLWTELVFEPASPAAGRGEIRLDGLRLESPDGRAAAEGPVTARLENGILEIRPVHLAVSGAGIEGAGFDLHGRADLDRSWNPFTDEPEAAIRNLDFDAGGTLEASLLNPFLEGGVASGALTFSGKASGPLNDLSGNLHASGPGASFFWAAPYATRVQDPEVSILLRDGGWRIDEAGMFLNGGPVQIAGAGASGEPLSLEAAFDRVRYRLDYGLTTLLSGRLALRMPPEGHSELSGRVTIDRALLDRDINLDREVLAAFLPADDTPGTEESFLSQIDLDLQVATVSGVRIRNNVANLRASWRPLSVTGTLEAPVIRGRVDIDPEGRLFAYGQTVRIDRGTLLFTGDPLLDPRIDMSTTSSLQDPSIARLRGTDSPLDLLEGNDPEDPLAKGQEMDEVVAAGLTGDLGARVVSQLGRAVGLERISVQPVLVFRETEDPSARLTAGGDLSRVVSFALSVDLRNAENRTYLLDFHNFRQLPGFALQGFTNDEGNEGASLQQVLELGGSRPRETRPRLDRLRLDIPPELPKRALRRAIRLQRRRPVPEFADFDVEIDLAEALRRRGYPDPRIDVQVVPVENAKNRVDVNVRIEPGPRAEIAFTGDRPPRRDRSAIAALYRPDFYEPAALEEMKQETLRAFRRRGHLEPQVEIAVASTTTLSKVTVHAIDGPRAKLERFEITGLDPSVGRLAASRFPGTLARVELATAAPGADGRLLGTLRALGYPDARVTGRELVDSGRGLVVRVEPGERQSIGRVEIAGVDEARRERLTALLPLHPGDPARLDRVSEGALRLESFLENEGFPDATVRPVVSPGTESPGSVNVRFEVTTGPPVQIAAIDFEGERWTRAKQLRKVSGLEPGTPFLDASVEEARARLFETGVFSRVTAEVDRDAEGEARVTFSLTERPRFGIRYGVRWDNGADKASAVVDLTDSNFLGRALTLGLRGLYEPNDQSGRAYLRTGGLFGTGISLETYAQARRFVEEGLIEDTREGALQLARPFGPSLTGRLYLRYLTTHLYEEEPDPFFPFDLQIDRPYLGMQALWDTRDDRIDPAGGLFASLDLSGSGSWAGSDFEYGRLFGQVNTWRRVSLLGRPLVWAQSVRGGWAQAWSDQELLRSERFFAGGELSVRGYETETLGPQEVLGSTVRPLGGEALFIVNQELRFPLPFDLTGLLFFDAGEVWETADDLDTDLSKALGLGLRARTPLGLIRLDVGFPLDRRPGDDEYKLYFGFGNAF